MPARGMKRTATASLSPDSNGRAWVESLPGSRVLSEEQLMRLQGGSLAGMDSDKDSDPMGDGKPKRKAQADPPTSRKAAKDFPWAPPLPLTLTGVSRGPADRKPSLMGVGSFAGVASPLQSSSLSVPSMLESPRSQDGGSGQRLLSPKGMAGPVSAADLFSHSAKLEGNAGTRPPLSSPKLPPKSPVLKGLSNGQQIVPPSPSPSSGSMGSMRGIVGGSNFLHPSMQGQILQQPKLDCPSLPPSPNPINPNQELLQRIQQQHLLQQQNKRQEAAQQHYLALQQKLQQQQIQQQKILQSLQTPPSPKPPNPAAGILSAGNMGLLSGSDVSSEHPRGGDLTNPSAKPALTQSRSSNSRDSGGSGQTHSVPLYLSQADKLPPRNAGSCARRLMQYMYHQRKRSADNSIEFWRQFVAEYFAPGAKKRWCVSCYSHSGRSPAGVFPQEVWHCELCGADPGRGFETTAEVLPRLFQVKYDSGVLEELLYVDIPNEYMLSSGVHILEYHRAVQESVFDQLRVVRHGQLRIVFSRDEKILSWEFCAHGHDEHVPRRSLLTQAAELAFLASKLQEDRHNPEELQTHCTALAAVTKQLALNLEQPTVNDLGFTKRYVRCLQISEVVDNMKDLISFNEESGLGPIASLMAFPTRNERARPQGLQGPRPASNEGGEHPPPFREEPRPTPSHSFQQANEPDPETAFQQYVQQKLGRTPLPSQPEGPVAMRSPLSSVGMMGLVQPPGLQTGPDQLSGGSLMEQFSPASILRGPAKHGIDMPTSSGGGGGFRMGMSDAGNGLTTMSQIQAMLMQDNDDDDLDVAGLGVSDPSPDTSGLDEFMFRMPS